MYSLARKRNGPEPTISVTGLAGSVFASRSGIMKAGERRGLPMASNSRGKGRFSRTRTVRSSAASSFDQRRPAI